MVNFLVAALQNRSIKFFEHEIHYKLLEAVYLQMYCLYPC